MGIGMAASYIKENFSVIFMAIQKGLVPFQGGEN
jgi:hypothetical protein